MGHLIESVAKTLTPESTDNKTEKSMLHKKIVTSKQDTIYSHVASAPIYNKSRSVDTHRQAQILTQEHLTRGEHPMA